MRLLGFVFIIIGLVALYFVVTTFLSSSEKSVSPIIENDGVKVIYETPSPES